MSFSVYILESDTTGRFYIGHTQSVAQRLVYHNSGYSKALKNRGPWKLIHCEQYGTRSEAMKRERQLKSRKDRDMIKRLVSASR